MGKGKKLIKPHLQEWTKNLQKMVEKTEIECI